MLLLAGRLVVWANDASAAWGGNYPPCDRHAELLKYEHKELGVRFSTADPELAAEFARAMDFWAGVLDIDWREEDTRKCSIQIVDGSPDLFETAQVARAQFPQLPVFQGLVAFNPKANLPGGAKYLAAVHELGHLLGLPHNPNAQSVMFYLLVDRPVFLDATDLAALAARHRLRPLPMDQPLIIDSSSVLIACSFATIRFFAASRHASANHEALDAFPGKVMRAQEDPIIWRSGVSAVLQIANGEGSAKAADQHVMQRCRKPDG